MLKVRDYLDQKMTPDGVSYVGKKPNGHYQVFGSWIHNIDNNQIKCTINNETITIAIILNYKHSGLFGYLQTYEHIPRGEPDIHGYYQRSTNDEIIKYIEEHYFQKITQL